MGAKQNVPEAAPAESFGERVQRNFAESEREMLEFFRRCDAEREKRYNAGDTGVYEEV